METTTAKKKPGNPAFTQREKRHAFEPFKPIPEKTYEFELIDTVKAGKPVDRDNDKPLEVPYPRVYTRPNEGVYYDEQVMQSRSWRYIVGQPSIWVDEQPQLKDADKKEIGELLGRAENQIEFIWGKCLVEGTQETKLHALILSDAFETKNIQHIKGAPRRYRLVNPDKAIQTQLDSGELEYKAMKLAHEAEQDEMLRAAFVMGIPVDDLSKSGLNKIKAMFRNKAKLDPTNPKAKESLEFFISVMENPMTKLKYIFSQAFTQGILSITQQPGKLTWALPNSAIMEVLPNANVVDQLCALVLEHDELSMQVFEQVEQELNNMTE